jgi:hypothetical protein
MKIVQTTTNHHLLRFILLLRVLLLRLLLQSKRVRVRLHLRKKCLVEMKRIVVLTVIGPLGASAMQGAMVFSIVVSFVNVPIRQTRAVMIDYVLVFLISKLNPVMPRLRDVVRGSITTLGLNVTSVVTEVNGKPNLAFVTALLLLMMLAFIKIPLKP